MELSRHSPICFDDRLFNYAEEQLYLTVQDCGTGHKETEISRVWILDSNLVFTSQRTNSVSATQTNRLLVCADIIIVDWENRTVQTNTLWAQNADFSNVTACGTYNYH
jgi:hypothetical protein